MYIIVDTARYNNVTRHIIPNQTVEYIAADLPIIDNFTTVTLYEENGFELRRDVRVDYHRFESHDGILMLTQLPLVEYKTIIDENRFYVCQGKTEDGVVVEPVGEGYIGVNVAAPQYRQYTEDTRGFIKPKLSMVLIWEEGATAEEIAEWEQTHHRPISIEERMDAAEAAIRALMG